MCECKRRRERDGFFFETSRSSFFFLEPPSGGRGRESKTTEKSEKTEQPIKSPQVEFLSHSKTQLQSTRERERLLSLLGVGQEVLGLEKRKKSKGGKASEQRGAARRRGSTRKHALKNRLSRLISQSSASSISPISIPSYYK